MTSPGVTVRPIELIDGGHEVNEVWFEDVRVPAENLVGELNDGWDYAKFLLGNERVGVAPVGVDQAGARAGQGASRGPVLSTTRWSRPGSPTLENELLALELTALRVVAQLRGRQAAPRLVGAQAQGLRAPAGGQRAGRRPGRAGLAGLRRRRRLRARAVAAPRRHRPTSTSARPPSTAARTRSNGRSSPRRSWGSDAWTSPTTSEQKALREAVRGLVGKAYADFEKRRQTVAEDPGFDEKLWQRLAEMGMLGLPFSEEDGGVGAGPVELGIVAQELGRVLAPEPFLTSVVLAGGLVAAAGSAEQQAVAARRPGRRRVACWPSRTPSRVRAGRPPRVGDGHRVRRRVDAVRRQGAGAARRPRRRARGQRGAGPAAAPACSWSTATRRLSRAGYPTHDGGRAARVAFDDTPAEPLGEPGGDASVAIERVHTRPHRAVQPGARRDGGRRSTPPRSTSPAASSSASRSTRSRR